MPFHNADPDPEKEDAGLSEAMKSSENRVRDLLLLMECMSNNRSNTSVL